MDGVQKGLPLPDSPPSGVGILRRSKSCRLERRDCSGERGPRDIQDDDVAERHEAHAISKGLSQGGSWLAQPDPLDSVEEQKREITGVNISNRPEDIPFTIFECYCQTDVRGDEHKDDDGEITGLPRPYKVTIDKTSRSILEIRRNWKQGDEMERPKKVFVKFSYVPWFGFYDIGLIQIMGNPVTAATALLRIAIDAGIFGNFPVALLVREATSRIPLTSACRLAGLRRST